MKSHDVAVIETTALSGGHPSEVIRSGVGLTPRPHSHRVRSSGTDLPWSERCP